MGLSTNTTTYAGGAQTFAVNFALGFLSRADVQVRVNAAVDGSGDPVYTAFSWIDDSAISVIPTLTIGDIVEVLRTVSKTALVANFAANTDVTPANLDISAKQGLMVYQELIDGRVEGTESPIIAADRAVAAANAAEASEIAVAADLVITTADRVSSTASEAASATNASQAASSASAASTSKIAAELAEVNAETAETNASASAGAAATSASASATSETNSATSASSAAASASSAANSLDSFDDRYLGAKASGPTLDNDGDALIDGALYFDTTNNVMNVYDLGTVTWVRTTPTASNQLDINTVVGISASVTTVAGISADVTAVTAISADVTTVAGISADVTAVVNDAADIGTVSTNIANVNTVATNIAAVSNVSTNMASVTDAAGPLTSIQTAMLQMATAFTNSQTRYITAVAFS